MTEQIEYGDGADRIWNDARKAVTLIHCQKPDTHGTILERSSPVE